MQPTKKGVPKTKAPGAIISFNDYSVEILMHLSKSGLASPVLIKGFFYNYLLISITIMLAAFPTALRQRAEKA